MTVYSGDIIVVWNPPYYVINIYNLEQEKGKASLNRAEGTSELGQTKNDVPIWTIHMSRVSTRKFKNIVT